MQENIKLSINQRMPNAAQAYTGVPTAGLTSY